ncbi:cilia- and flagella-associated protein 418 isoform X2 [Cynoglossus semilaevis]|uniref:cilia- and flagella-associated protein 418 isoform X2 n=1 Tax=Cynoglossus semilaevis TaxID=244447 RepID=UPI00049526B9|nr:protein C8orf37 homolog isoform X2 [Cynoglossus semilaevis]
MDPENELDELLDEVERKFCRDVSITDTSDTGSRRLHRARTSETTNLFSEEVDNLLKELLEDEKPQDVSKLKFPCKDSGAEQKFCPQSGGRRCCPVFIGGSSYPVGIGTSTSERVLMFDHNEWDTSCDYLFFRNHMPDHQKLQTKLKKRRGFRAYACQCSWFCCSELMDLSGLTQLKWICGRHLN